MMITKDSVFKLRSDLIIHTSPDTPARFLLEDPQSGRVFTFKQREFTIISLLDGVSPLNVVTKQASHETGLPLSISTVSRFIERLSGLKLLEQHHEQEQADSISQTANRKYIEIKLERWSHLLRFIARLFFSAFPGYVLCALTLLVLLAETFFWHDIYARGIQHYFSWPAMPLTFFLLYACLPVIMFIHEMGHVLAAFHFLHRLYSIRVYRFYKGHVSLPPAAIWSLRTRAPRIMIALAGLYFQTLLLLLIGALWGSLGQQPVIGLICTAFSIPLIGSFLLSVIPVVPGLLEMKTDGYFALSYLLNIPNLAARARAYRASRRDSRDRPPTWLAQLTRFQRAGFLCYVSVLPWLGLALILGAFSSVSIQVLWPIPTTGAMVIAIIAFWLIWPYLWKPRERPAG